MFGSEVLGLRAGESASRSQPSAWGYWNGDGWWVDTAGDPWTGDSERCQRVPEDLETMVPGRALVEVVWGADRSRLSGYDLVRLLQAEARLVAHFQAGLYATVTEISGILDDPDTAAAEVAAGLCLTRAASEAECRLALALARFPQVREALARGEIDLRRARVLVDATVGLCEETATGVVDRVLLHASELTTGQLRARLSRLRMELDAESAKVNIGRHWKTVGSWSKPTPTGLPTSWPTTSPQKK